MIKNENKILISCNQSIKNSTTQFGPREIHPDGKPSETHFEFIYFDGKNKMCFSP